MKRAGIFIGPEFGTVLKAKMNPDLHMTDKSKNTGDGANFPHKSLKTSPLVEIDEDA